MSSSNFYFFCDVEAFKVDELAAELLSPSLFVLSCWLRLSFRLRSMAEISFLSFMYSSRHRRICSSMNLIRAFPVNVQPLLRQNQKFLNFLKLKAVLNGNVNWNHEFISSWIDRLIKTLFKSNKIFLFSLFSIIY